MDGACWLFLLALAITGRDTVGSPLCRAAAGGGNLGITSNETVL